MIGVNPMSGNTLKLYSINNTHLYAKLKIQSVVRKYDEMISFQYYLPNDLIFSPNRHRRNVAKVEWLKFGTFFPDTYLSFKKNYYSMYKNKDWTFIIRLEQKTFTNCFIIAHIFFVFLKTDKYYLSFSAFDDDIKVCLGWIMNKK